MKKLLILFLSLCILLGLCLQPAAAEADPLLTLVNPWNTVPADWKVDLVDIGSGHKVDRRCYDDLMAMLAACRAAGLSPVVRSSYRTQATQQYLFNNKITQMKAQGYKGDAAVAKAATIVARPGTSEHQLGWAVDIVDRSYQVLDEKQANTAAQKWLMAHSWEYGFILRYPTDKSAVTGIIYEPWHYRYVGRENAKAIQASGLCLEEYLTKLEADRKAEEEARRKAEEEARRKAEEEARRKAEEERLRQEAEQRRQAVLHSLETGRRAAEQKLWLALWRAGQENVNGS